MSHEKIGSQPTLTMAPPLCRMAAMVVLTAATNAAEIVQLEQPWGRRLSSIGPGPVSTPPPTKPPTAVCHGGVCGGMAHYPVAPGHVFYSEMDVPA